MTTPTPTSHAKPARRWPWVILGAVLMPVAAFFLFAVFAVATPHPVASPAPVGTVPTMPMPIVPAPTQAAPPTKVIHGITDGNDYQVGRDVPSGRYHTDGSHSGSVPYATVEGTDGHIVKVINVDGPSNVTLKDGQVFSTHGGVVWEYMDMDKSS